MVADAWTAAMLGLWNAGLWVLRLVLRLDRRSADPGPVRTRPGRGELYRTTFWLAGVVMVVMLLVQLGVGGVRRSGRGGWPRC